MSIHSSSFNNITKRCLSENFIIIKIGVSFHLKFTWKFSDNFVQSSIVVNWKQNNPEYKFEHFISYLWMYSTHKSYSTMLLALQSANNKLKSMRVKSDVKIAKFIRTKLCLRLPIKHLPNPGWLYGLCRKRIMKRRERIIDLFLMLQIYLTYKIRVDLPYTTRLLYRRSIESYLVHKGCGMVIH